MRNNYLFIFITMLVLSRTAQSQSIANYTSSRTTGISYTSIISTGSPVNAWRNTGTLPQDDNRSDFVSIGFDFWYNGTRYTDLSLSTNGFLDFSTSTDDGGPQADDFGYSNAAFTSATAGNETRPAIAPFYDDLTAAGGGAPLGNSIKYELSGTAPNRVFTAEWINMAVYGNTAPDLDFQVKIYETTGIIEVLYDTMDAGGHTFSYTMGINANTMSNPPLATQLKTLQTANSNTFSQTVQNNLTTLPTQASKYTFTPPTPLNPSGALTFSAITSTGMTLNWTNWATNEVGYVIYNSTDGINYTFVAQTAVNATSRAITGLLASTTYYWQVYAVTEGRLSNALSGTQATAAGTNKVSAASGNWNTAGTWTPAGVPGAGDNVTIANGHTVSINATVACNKLTVGQGTSGILEFSGGAIRTLTVNDSLQIKSGAIFNVNTGSNVTHSLVVKNHMVNNGTLNMATDANSLCNISLTKNGDINLTGVGTSTNLNLLTVNLGTSKSNVFHVASTNFSAPAGFLTLSNGTFKISSSGSVNITPFSVLTTLNSKTKLWLNSSSVTINTGAGLNVYGDIEISDGTLNVGNASDEDLVSYGGFFIVNNGNLNIAGKFYTFDINNLVNLTLHNGTLSVPVFGSTNTSIAPFSITSPGSTLNMSGGTIVLVREGGSGAQDLGYVNTGSSLGAISGGTLQIGNGSSPAGQIISINASYDVPNLAISSANVTAKVSTNPLVVSNGITINSGSLDANNMSIYLGGNWNNVGGTFIAGSGTVYFDGTSAQSIFKSGGETFNSVNFSNLGTKTLASSITCNANLNIENSSTLDVSTSNFSMDIKGSFTNNGTLNTRSGLVSFTGSSAQTIGGSALTHFYDLTINNTSGGVSLTSSQDLSNTLTISNGIFNTNGQSFTLLSTAARTARIAQITGTGDISGNITLQRFIPGGSTGWVTMGFPFTSSQTFADIDDDLIISCLTCPDGYTGAPSIYSYDETLTGSMDVANAFVGINTINDATTHTLGYYVYTGDGPTTTNDITLDMTGSVGKMNTSIPLTYTNSGSASDDGWNLISNPYPSPILWSLLKGATPNIDNAIYVYNADLAGGTGSFSSFVNGISSPAISSGGIGDTIAMYQGFLVHSTGATSLSATESIKVAGNPTFLRTDGAVDPSTTSTNPLIRIQFAGQNFTDETVLYYFPGATTGFDAGFDALKIPTFDPLAPQICLIGSDSEKFQINAVEPIIGTYSAPLKTSTGHPGMYTIEALGAESFPSGMCIQLVDHYTQTSTDLKTNTYTFFHSDTTILPRFSLQFTMNPVSIDTLITQPSCEDSSNSVVISSAGSGPWTYIWQNANDSVIQLTSNTFSADSMYNLLPGQYSVEIQSSAACTGNWIYLNILNPSPSVAYFELEDTLGVNDGLTIQPINQSINALTYLWNFGDGNTDQSLHPMYTYDSAGTYLVSLIASSALGCVDTFEQSITLLDTNKTAIYTKEFAQDWVKIRVNESTARLEFTQAMENTTEIQLVNALGQVFENQKIVHANTIELNLQKLASGIYIIKVYAGTKQKDFRIFIR